MQSVQEGASAGRHFPLNGRAARARRRVSLTAATAFSPSYEFIAAFSKRSITWFIQLDYDGKIDGFFIRPVMQQLHLSDQALIVALDSELQRNARTGFFSGAVLIAKDGQAMFEEAYGLEDRERGTLNTTSTKFRIGSMNKMFTGVAVLQLCQNGKIRLDDSLRKYLPDYPNNEIASRATIRELLTHTAGTGDIFGPVFDQHRLELQTLNDYLKLYGRRSPQFVPGTRYTYSNYGYILLGAIIERVSGQSYYDYVRQHIYEPAGMDSTGSEPENIAVPDRANGYTKDGGEWRLNSNTLPYRGTSAGGGYSTVGDLLKFANALQSHKLLNAMYTRALTTGIVSIPSLPDNTRRYALGLVEQRVNSQTCFGHDGGAPGMSGDLQICPSSGFTIVVLANIDPPLQSRSRNLYLTVFRLAHKSR